MNFLKESLFSFALLVNLALKKNLLWKLLCKRTNLQFTQVHRLFSSFLNVAFIKLKFFHVIKEVCFVLCILCILSMYLLWYFVTKIVLTYCEKKLFKWSKKTSKIRDWRPRIWKFFEMTRTIYSNSERSEKFLVTECFFNLILEVSQIW